MNENNINDSVEMRFCSYCNNIIKEGEKVCIREVSNGEDLLVCKRCYERMEIYKGK